MSKCDVCVCVLCDVDVVLLVDVLSLGCACCRSCIVLCCVCARFVQNNAMCKVKTLPCVLSKRCRVCRQNARVTLDTGVLTAHTGAFQEYTRGGVSGRLSLCLSLSLVSYVSLSRSTRHSLLVSLSFSICSSLFLSFFCFLSALSLSLSVFNDDDYRRHTALACPEGQGACTLAHSLLGEHVRIMHETIVQVVLSKPWCHLEWSGPVSVLEMERCLKEVWCVCAVCLCVLVCADS